jgi:ParB-like chromosome segregation protein Spo0J
VQAMMAGEIVKIAQIGLSYSRVRCLAPRQIEQMKASLTTHGQLTELIVVKRGSKLELIDGFKRRRAANEMGWTRLRVTPMDLDEPGQWAAMLALNRATHSMTRPWPHVVSFPCPLGALSRNQLFPPIDSQEGRGVRFFL